METDRACVICGGQGEVRELNGLRYFECPACALLWRTEQSLPPGHYEEKESGLTPEKQAARIRNSRDRIRAMGRRADFNDLCDLGGGEGTTLAAAYDMGYRNLVGIDPAAYVEGESRDPRFDLVRGTDEDLARVMGERHLRNVSLFHVIEHFSRPDESMKRIAAAMPAGGFLAIETPDARSYSLRISDYRHDLIYPEHFFLFTSDNLCTLLKQSGFEIVARGRRDFDQFHLPVSELLFRLGIRKKNHVRNRMAEKKNVPGAASSVRSSSVFRRAVRACVAFVGFLFVALLRRQDYIWVVARKA